MTPHNRVVILTGASQGIGRATAYTLADPVTICTRVHFIPQWLFASELFCVYAFQWLSLHCAVILAAQPMTGKRRVILRLRYHTGI